GNCCWPDANWVHAFHAAWNNRDSHAPISFRLRNSWSKNNARRKERRSLGSAQIILTNSQPVRQRLMNCLPVPPERIHVVFLGIDPDSIRGFNEADRLAARQRLAWAKGRPVVVFVGALGHDRNKGFDLVFAAWETLCKDPAWDVDLVAAGSGAEVSLWRRRAE